MSNYRKIYKQHYGEIPRDETGRRYEIHHIDGNHKNDSPENLTAITIQKHYDIHYSQEDWGACFKIASRMKLSAEEISELGRKNALQKVNDGTHPFLGGDLTRDNNRRRIADGTHQFLGPALNRKRVENGTHNFLGGEVSRRAAQKKLADGSHHFITNHPNKNMPQITCPYCGRTGGRNAMKQWHFDNCKKKP
jgi:hypothetical protein